MALRNRVDPFGELVATASRGLVYGNRGCLHDGEGRIRRRFNGRRWISCRLEFRGWQRGPLLQPGRFTELFFLDEATAFAAGHRPCALCRHDDYRTFVERWQVLHAHDAAGVDAIDRRLHAERVESGTRRQRRHAEQIESLPDGSFIVLDGAPFLVLGPELLRWSAAGYSERAPRPETGQVTTLTPPSLVALLRTGWRGVVPLLHPSAD